MLASLEVELLAAILEFVDDESPWTTKSIQLVNRHFNATAELVAHRRKTLDFSQKDSTISVTLDSLTKWLDEEALLLRHIRHLTIIGHPQYFPPRYNVIKPEGDSYKWIVLARLLEKLGKLKTLTFNYHGQFPLIVLEALHKHQPKAQLRIYDFQRPTATLDHNDEAEIALARSPALTALKASVWRDGCEGHPDLREAAFRRILASAPNLRFASITTGHSGCMIRRVSEDEVAEKHEKSAFFYSHKQPNNAVRALTLDGYGLSKATLHDWGQFVDLSSLESLKCSRGLPDHSYFTVAPTLLNNLKHVSLNLGFNTDADLAAAVDNYLCSCSPLESLSLWSWMDVVSLATILKHGPSLKSLQLHERETISSDRPRRLLSHGDVKLVRDRCQRLKDFTMDINREEENWEDEMGNPAIFKELGLFEPQLDRVQLYFELGIAWRIDGHGFGMTAEDGTSDQGGVDEGDDNTNQRHPKKHKVPFEMSSRATAVEYATFIWKTIFGAKTTGRRALDIKIGEWEKKLGTGYPAEWVTWEQTNKQFWTIRPHERDDRPGEVVVKPWEGYK